jgi:demethylmenaquinone methyltransferase/2-methoxy-6-polyprenyl-1,4-benzoquinol methylase
MNLLDFLGDIVIFGFSDLIDNKKVSHKTRKRLLITFIIVSLCYVGSFLFCILWGIKQDNIILSVLGILCILFYLYLMIKTVRRYNESKKKINKDNVKEFFDFFAPRWDNEPIAEKEIINTILDNAEITEGINVLDIGCGTGVMFPFYMERNVQSITAVDLSPEMVKIAKSKFPQATVICGDAENITFDKNFDVVMIYNAFPHFPDPEKLIENLSKHLKDGGRLSIAHGMSKKELDDIHMKSASYVSNILPECDELAKMFSPYFNVDIKISDNKMYQVTGTKK